jgi:NADPH:quinone reductase-like Zn-dependent oxidoreductase
VADHPDPLASDDVELVRVLAAPIVRLDLLCASGTSYFGPPALPYVPGGQGVGLTPGGRRVWFTTDAGQRPGDGSLAELVAVPNGRLLPLPDGVPDPVVAALGLSAVAAARALERGSLAAGETVAVLGASGMVGQVAVQMARVLGAGRVVAVVRSRRDVELARDQGADAVAELVPEDVGESARRIAAASDGPLHLVVDPVWGAPAAAAFAALAPGGRLVNLGDSAGPTVQIASAALRSRWVEVRGYTNLSITWEQQCASLLAVLDRVREGTVVVRHEVGDLSRVADAWAANAAGSSVRYVLRP